MKSTVDRDIVTTKGIYHDDTISASLYVDGGGTYGKSTAYRIRLLESGVNLKAPARPAVVTRGLIEEDKKENDITTRARWGATYRALKTDLRMERAHQAAEPLASHTTGTMSMLRAGRWSRYAHTPIRP